MSRGYFVSLEGTEGSGKSTQAALLVDRLRAGGFRARGLREPGGTPLGEEIRHTLKHSQAGAGMVPEAELLLMNAARAQLVREVIQPALDAGEVVVTDRYFDSTVAYQGWGRGLDLARVREVVALAVGSTVPDLTLLFDVPPEVSAARRRARGLESGDSPGVDRFEREDEEFFDRVAAGFRAVAESDPARVVVVDGSEGVEAVSERVWEIVRARLELAQRGV
ncbi:MAG: dTMP kinase [Limisphaerales bacterium]